MYRFKSTLLALSLLAALSATPVNGDIPTGNSGQILTKSTDNQIAYLGWRADRARGNYANDYGYGYNDNYGYRGYRGFRGDVGFRGDRGIYNYPRGYDSDSNYYQNGRFNNNNWGSGFGLFSGGCGC